MSYLQTVKSIIFFLACLLLPHSVAAEQQGKPGCDAKYVHLKTANDQRFTAYVAGPENAKQGLLLIHGWWGLNQEMETWANQFAFAGYRVMAVDLYSQQVTTNPARAKQLMNGVKQSVANEKYAAAIEALSAPERKVAIIGRSYGANQALHAAMVAQEKASATILYYPFKAITDKKILQAIKAPVLGHFAQHDYFFTPDMLSEFTAAAKTSGLTMSVNIYDARHAFASPTGKNFNMAASKLSQHRTYEFLNEHLK